MRGHPLLLVLVFVAGVGLGYLLQPAPMERARTQPPPGVSTEVSHQAPSPTLKQAIDALPRPERLPDGNGTITGRVTDQAGQPVVGALVVATPEFPRPGIPAVSRG